MKNLINILCVFLLTLVLFSCEKDPIPVPNHNLSPVYSLTEVANVDDASDKNVPFKVNVYTEKDYLAVWSSSVKLNGFNTEMYLDQSTADEYIISFTTKETETELNVDTNIEETLITTIQYSIVAYKATGLGEMSVETTMPDGSQTTIKYSFLLKLTELYI